MRRRLAQLRHRHLYAVAREMRSANARHDLLARLQLDAVPAATVMRASTDVGELLLHAADQVMTPYIREHGTWEPDEGAWLRRVLAPGQTVVDCGANIGYFTVLASRAVGERGRVLAIEPDPDNLRLLRLNLWLNDCGNVTVCPVAAWRERGMLALRRSPVNMGDHRVYAAGGDVLVACAPLDELVSGPVDVIKIDTQGADHEVLAGTHGTLAACPRARVLVEFWAEGMAERRVDPVRVLAGYRALRPVGLLRPGGEVLPADDAAILGATEWAGRWVNLVLLSAPPRL